MKPFLISCRCHKQFLDALLGIPTRRGQNGWYSSYLHHFFPFSASALPTCSDTNLLPGKHQLVCVYFVSFCWIKKYYWVCLLLLFPHLVMTQLGSLKSWAILIAVSCIWLCISALIVLGYSRIVDNLLSKSYLGNVTICFIKLNLHV